MRAAICSLILATAAFGQLQFYSVGDSGNVPIRGSYTVTAAVGDQLEFLLRVGNSGTSAVTVSRVGLSGQGFSIVVTPTKIAPGRTMDLRVTYSPTASGSYSANLAVYDTSGAIAASIVLVGSAVVAPTISISQDGQRQDIPNGKAIDFGRIRRGLTGTITVSLENRSTTTMVVKSMQLSGSGAFTIANGPTFPLRLDPTESGTFDLKFVPTQASQYSAAIVVDTRTIPVTGIGFDPSFAPVSIVVEPALVSGIQSPISITLPQPAPLAASGTLTLGFQPSATGGADDAAVRFMAAGGRVLTFSFNQGDTTAKIGTATSAMFQTGTTAGTLTFFAAFQGTTVQAVSKVQPQVVQIDSTSSSRPNDGSLRVLLAGYDNSKSTTQLAFTFYDANGATILPGRITYNASTDFLQFFQHSLGGGMFSLLADFPVSGSAAKVGSVDVELTNVIGTTKLPRLLFACVPSTTVTCQ